MSNINYSGDVTLQSTFRVERNLPIDDRFVVNSEEELKTIHNPYIGMRVSLAGEAKLFILTKSDASNLANWQEVSGVGGGAAAGIPVYRSDADAQHYRAEEYLSLEPLSHIETESGTTGGYIQTLFQAMRVLENKVMQLQNAFKYGINSYCGTETAIANLNGEMEASSEEPLWAIDESGLSSIDEIDKPIEGSDDNNNPILISQSTELSESNSFKFVAEIPSDNDSQPDETRWRIDSSVLNLLTFYGSDVYWEDRLHLLETLLDPKLFTYLTLSTKNLKFKLKEISTKQNSDENSEEEPELKTKEISISNLLQTECPIKVLLIISKTVTKKENETELELGKNFVWLQISRADNNSVLREGYVDFSNDEVSLSEELVTVDARYFLHQFVIGPGTTLYKFELYTRYQDFSYEVIPSLPEDQEEYKFKAAHITIRAVLDVETLTKVSKLLQQNELIFVEADRTLRIKTSQNKIIVLNAGGNINGDNNNEQTMATLSEVLEHLKKIGIVKTSGNEDTGYNIALNNVSGFTFISETDKKYNIGIDKHGEVQVTEAEPETLETWFKKKYDYELNPFVKDSNGEVTKTRLLDTSSQYDADLKPKSAGFFSPRGLIANVLSGGKYSGGTDLGLKGDRVRISAFYAPLYSDKYFSCTHGFVELENSSDQDIPLNGCYLHLFKYDEYSNKEVYHVELKGWIPAGGTYLIRAKKYAEPTDANIVINVDSYDVEWFESSTSSELVDFTIYDTFPQSPDNEYCAFCLTYGLSDLPAGTQMISSKTGTVLFLDYKNTESFNTANPKTKSGMLITNRRFIDSCKFTGTTITKNSKNNIHCKWVGSTSEQSVITLKPNSMFRMTFALDPAKQGYTAFTTADSSRVRWQKASDLQVVLLNEFLEFPKSSLKREVSWYTPKASWLHKNVITDKTKLDHNRPNAVTVSFGIDVYDTRCFNWVSGGVYDEYVWIRKQGAESWSTCIPSYTALNEKDSMPAGTSATIDSKTISRKEYFTTNTYTVVNKSVTFTVNNGYLTLGTETKSKEDWKSLTIENSTDPKYADFEEVKENDNIVKYTANEYAHKILVSEAVVNNNVYARIINLLPGSGDTYTVHKCILTGFKNHISDSKPLVWEYVVGRKNIKNQPDELHCSDIQTFTVYPDNWEGRVYQITDLQGFHWIEYQVWTGAAEHLNQVITQEMEEAESEKVFPILINTGDMTQSGARINEWLDYYQGGQCLFNHLEQMNVVGNNDLCGEDVRVMGTGNDAGKSNSYFHHVFYCYEIPFSTTDPSKNLALVVKGHNNDYYHYLPSIFYIKTKNIFYLFLNSEFTYTTCLKQFGLDVKGWKYQEDGVSKTYPADTTINIYTGFTCSKADGAIKLVYYTDIEDPTGRKYPSVGDFTPVYDTIYSWLQENADSTDKKEIIMACHEIPFTVITNGSLGLGQSAKTRTYPDQVTGPSNSLGCHMNQLTPVDFLGSYWISRLLEWFGCKLCIGGHKHTYAISLPLAEYYFYENSAKNSALDGPKRMLETLEDEATNKVLWTYEEIPNEYETLGEGEGATQVLKSNNLKYYDGEVKGGSDAMKISTTKLPLIPLDDTTGNASLFMQTTRSTLKNPKLYCSGTLVSNYDETKLSEGEKANNELKSEIVKWQLSADPKTNNKLWQNIKDRSITYFMCLATGYKVVSNKELPSAWLLFSEIIPQTAIVDGTDTVNQNLLYPMYGKIHIKLGTNKVDGYDLYLARIENIAKTTSTAQKFDLVTYGTGEITVKYLTGKKEVVNGTEKLKTLYGTQYGTWGHLAGATTEVSDVIRTIEIPDKSPYEANLQNHNS